MHRHTLDCWTDTTAFGIALAMSGALVLPVLAIGLVVSLWMIGVAVVEQTAEPAGAVIVVLAAGGAAGIFGWLRARNQVRSPGAYDITATLVCLAIGSATALAVGAIVAVALGGAMLKPWGVSADAWPVLLFAPANVIWALSGVGWMQRLLRRYAEHTGRAFDGLPAMLLFVAVALATAVTLAVTTL